MTPRDGHRGLVELHRVAMAQPHGDPKKPFILQDLTDPFQEDLPVGDSSVVEVQESQPQPEDAWVMAWRL